MARNSKSSNNNSATARTSPPASSKKKSKGGGANRGDAPAAVSSRGLYSGPTITPGPKGATRFSNSEYLADVVPSGISSITNVVTINAGNPSSFPWLSRIGASFEVYRFRRLSVTYTPCCSSATPGMVVGAFEFDGTDALPINKQQISAMDHSARGNVWSKVRFDLPCPNGWYYCSVSAAVGADPRLTDVARFVFGVFAANTGMTVGELSVSYDVELAKPDAMLVSGSEQISISGGTLAYPAGSSSTIKGDDLFGLSSPTAGTLNLTAKLSGPFLIQMTAYGQSSSNISSLFQTLITQIRNNTIMGTINGDGLGAWVNATTDMYSTLTFVINAVAGDVFQLKAQSTVTSLALYLMRCAVYRALS